MPEDNDKVNIKQRIIGAIVIISLGIILVPMLLNKQDVHKFSSTTGHIPDLPDKLKRTLSSPIKSIPLHEPMPKVAHPQANPVDDVNIKLYEDEPPMAKKTSQKKVSKAANKKQSNKVKKAKTLAKQKNKVQKTKKFNKTKKSNKSKVNKNPYKDFYVLQVGSFSSAKNAQALTHKLQKKKFKAYIEMIKLADGKHYRVRIGPYLLHRQILKVQKQVSKVFTMKSKIIKQIGK